MKEFFQSVLESVKNVKSDDYAVVFVGELLKTTIPLEITDLHIEPQKEQLVIKVRKNGVLYSVLNIDKKYQKYILGRIKVLAQLANYEENLPQDGRIAQLDEMQDLNLRVSFLPTIHGGKCVIRFPERQSLIPLVDLGLSDDQIKQLMSCGASKSGMILFSGPGNSGKTTSLYAFLREIHSVFGQQLNIATIEDPVEYDLEEMCQSQVNADRGFTYYLGLKSILRQDPDVIMIGEIRDAETAYASFQAGLSGHLMMATFHSPSVAHTIYRLINLGVDPMVLASTLKVFVKQRLVSFLCPHCRIESNEPSSCAPVKQHFSPRGCKHCMHTGYAGRKPFFQLIEMNTQLINLMIQNVDFAQLQDYLRPQYGKAWNDQICKAIEAGEITLQHGISIMESAE